MRGILVFQALYYLITGIWPVVSLQSFELVTGEKTDDWLVQTVGVLAAAIGAALFVGIRNQPPNRETFTLAILSAAGFAAVDVVFVVEGVISRIYLVDAAIQGAILVGLLAAWWVRRRQALSG